MASAALENSIMDSDDDIDHGGSSGPTDEQQEGHGQEAPGHDDADDSNDDDDDGHDSKQNSANHDSTAAHGAGKHALESNKSSSIVGNSNKRPRHAHHDHHKRDNHNVKDGDKLRVDWDALADGPSGDVPLTRDLPFIERDNLLGWATHITQPTTRAVHSMMDDHDDEDDNGLFNPLLGLPNVPLPASMLFLLHEAAGEYLVAVNSKKKQHSTNSKPSTYNIFEAFDQSALVALGMVLEESITSSLLPLARAHVARCRHLEEQESKHPVAREESLSSFREWTLPPPEAVAKLQVYNRSVGTTTDFGSKRIEAELPSTRPPDRNAARPDSAQQECMPSAEEEQQHQDALDRWCKAHGLEPNFVLKNVDIFGSLVSGKERATTSSSNDK